MLDSSANNTPRVRVRYAPSPTGYPHVGNVRTALFNWLFARHHGGSFILRIEDTDVARTVEGAVEATMDALRWLGLDWDEGPGVGGDFGPYVQSQRLELYHQAARRMVEEGHAYLCYCSPQRLEEMRLEQAQRKQPTGYDRRCRYLSQEERAERESRQETAVIRFKSPLRGQVACNDLIRGGVVFETSTLDDFVLLKSDGYPTYHLASVVDDHWMQITHVLRAEEWLSSTPRHLLLYQALGFEPPLYAHLPMILGPDRAKLSKRHGATSVMDYRDQGYLPEALVNFLALLGWSLDDKTEVMGRQVMVPGFSLERVSKTPAIFSQEKLLWMNGVYVRSLAPEEFVEKAVPFLERGLPQEVERPLATEYVRQMAPLLQERAKSLGELPSLVDFFFLEELAYDSSLLLTGGMGGDKVREALARVSQSLVGIQDFGASTLEGALRSLASAMDIKTGVLFGLIRVAVTGRSAAPPLFQTMAVLGKERCLRRIERAIQKLEGC